MSGAKKQANEIPGGGGGSTDHAISSFVVMKIQPNLVNLPSLGPIVRATVPGLATINHQINTRQSNPTRSCFEKPETFRTNGTTSRSLSVHKKATDIRQIQLFLEKHRASKLWAELHVLVVIGAEV